MADFVIACARLWGNGAIERRARIEAEALVEAGESVVVVTDELPLADDDRLESIERLESIDVVSLPPGRLLAGRSAGKHLSFLVRTLAAGGRLTRSAGSRPVVVSHSPLALVGLANSPGLRRRGATVYVCHTLIGRKRQMAAASGEHVVGGGRGPTRLLVGRSDLWSVRHADLVVNLTDEATSRVGSIRGERRPSVVLPNPVDQVEFAPHPGVAKDIDVLYIGRLSRLKGLDVLMEAARRFPADARLVLVGEGSYRAEVERLAASVPCRVELWGFRDHEHLPGIINRARVVAMPSFAEVQPLVALEALSCGVPVVASAIGGLQSMVSHGVNGWLVEPGDAVTLSELLVGLLADPDRLSGMAVAARDSAAAYSDEHFRRDVVAVYRRVADGQVV